MAKLIEEMPLLVFPSLAAQIGLNEALVLQQLHYWLQRSKNVVDGTPWVYNTLEQWREQFPFMSRNTVQRTLDSLKKMGLVEASDKLNKKLSDRTLWYTILYEGVTKLGLPEYQNGTLLESTKMGRSTITENTTENTTESLRPQPHPKSQAVSTFREFTNRWPNKAQQQYVDLHVTDLDTWRHVLGEWLTRGYSPVNVKGMVEWYLNPSLIGKASSQQTFRRSNVQEGQDAADRLQQKLIDAGMEHLL